MTLCLLCKKNDAQYLFSGKDQMLRINGQYHFYKCHHCRTLFLYPQPILQKHYPPKRYYSLKGEDGIPGSGDALFRILYTKTTPILKILTFPLRKAFRSTYISSNGNFLDVGCGSGHFLVYMQTYNMQCYGVDPGQFSQNFANKHNLNIFHGYLHEANFPSNFFDVITINHTLEHVANPLEILCEMHRILKPGGTLIIGVPQLHSFAAKVFGKHWAELDIPRHLFVCSTKTLCSVAQKLNFSVKKIRYNSNPVSFIMSIIYWSNSWRKKTLYFEDINWKKPLYGALFFLFLPLCYLCDLFRVGDQVEIFVTKDEIT